MAAAEKKKAVIAEHNNIAKDIYSMWLEELKSLELRHQANLYHCFAKMAAAFFPDQSVSVKLTKVGEEFVLFTGVVGKGTKEFSTLVAGDHLDVMGPLGNGFTLEGKKAFLIGGGIGIPPLLELAKQLTCEKQMILGYRDITFLEKEFEAYGKVFVSTEDGSKGTKGNVLDAIIANSLEADMIFACGPTPMLRGIKAYAMEHGIKAQLSLEERMACGVGACLGCVCRTKEIDHHSNVNNKRICKDGPVFYAEEVEL